jgi:type I restriction enzyme S subunit
MPSLGLSPGSVTRIVAILGKFDALVNDLSSGLPAEPAARRKQYHYYRDRLLTCEDAAA